MTDIMTISCAVVGQNAAIDERRKNDIDAGLSGGIAGLIEDGYRIFCISLTGELTLMFCEALLYAAEQFHDLSINIQLPYKGWHFIQDDAIRYHNVIAQAESRHYASEEAFSGSMYSADKYLVGYGSTMVILQTDNCSEMFYMKLEAEHRGKQKIREFVL